MPRRVIGIAVAVVGLAACSSNNPDALNAANIDANYASSDSNLADNADAAAADAAARAGPAAAPANEAANSFQANVDAAVKSLKEAEAEQNEYCEDQQAVTGESDCDEN